MSKDRWETIRRLFVEERLAVSEIAPGLDLDRKTVRHWAHQSNGHPYSRARRSDTLLTEHEQFVRECLAGQLLGAHRLPGARAPTRLCGQHETVKRAVAPLRQLAGTTMGWFLPPIAQLLEKVRQP